MKYKLSNKLLSRLIRIVISMILLLIIEIVRRFYKLETIPCCLIYSIPYLVVGFDIIKGAIKGLLRKKFINEKFLMMLATIGAFATGQFAEGCAVMIFYQIGELFEKIAVGRSRQSISSLMDLCPDKAVLLKDGMEVAVSPSDVNQGETIIIRAGERIPLDGIIIEGNTSLDQSKLTGESYPVDVGANDTVLSGALNLTSVIKVRTISDYKESTVSRILKLVEESSNRKSRTENFISSFSKYYTPVVILLAALLAIVGPVITGVGDPGIWLMWLKRAMVFLVVSCPCALVVSVPLTFFSGIGGASRMGILIKGCNYVEALSKIDEVVFDKTGTLTKGSFEVEAIHTELITSEELIALAALLERYSNHPISQSIVKASEGKCPNESLLNINEIAGQGIEGILDGKKIYVGNSRLMDSIGVSYNECELVGTIIHVARESEYLGHIVIKDQIKSQSKDAISLLRKLGIIKLMMLTGDKREVSEEVRISLGLDEAKPELLPHMKVELLEKEISEGRKVAFVGDGINDAPSLMRADVGIAMGGLGSDAAIEASDVVLMKDNPMDIARAIIISRRTMRIVWQNIIMSLLIKVAILILSSMGLTNMWMAVIADVGVLILAILNAVRAMIRIKI